MPEYLSPGVYVEEIEIGSKPIEGSKPASPITFGKLARPSGETVVANPANTVLSGRVTPRYFGTIRVSCR